MPSWINRGVKTFLEERKVLLPFFSYDTVPLLAPGLKRIIALPDEERALWTVDKEGLGKPDDGLVRKDGGIYDKKWYFHYRQGLPADLASRGLDLHPYFKWLNAQRTLHRRCREFILQFAQALDLEMSGFDFARRLSEGHEKHVLRTLLYDPPEPGQIELAQEHFDKSSITLQLGESHPGLWIDSRDKKYVVPENHTLVFAGVKLESRTEGKIKASLHGVIEEKPAVAKQRWSIIFFAHTLDPVPASFKEK